VRFDHRAHAGNSSVSHRAQSTWTSYQSRPRIMNTRYTRSRHKHTLIFQLSSFDDVTANITTSVSYVLRAVRPVFASSSPDAWWFFSLSFSEYPPESIDRFFDRPLGHVSFIGSFRGSIVRSVVGICLFLFLSSTDISVCVDITVVGNLRLWSVQRLLSNDCS